MFYKHMTFFVKELDASIAFYETLAELTVLRRFSEGPAKLAFLANRDGETELEFFCLPQAQTFEGKGFFISFVTDKLDEMHALATSKGYHPSEIRNPSPASRYFYAYDPNGISVQIKADL